MVMKIAPGPNGESCIRGAGASRARSRSEAPAPAEAPRLTVIGGVLADDRAKSLVEFIRAHLDPGLQITVQRAARPHYHYTTQTNLEIVVTMRGAEATFALEDPYSYGANGCPYSSIGWGQCSSRELARLNAFFKQGKVGEYLDAGQSGARSYGGVWVDEARDRAPTRRTY